MYNPKKHREIVKGWWQAQGHHIVDEKYLPEDSGIVLYKGKTPLLACWLYATKTAMCFLDHAVVNPQIRRKERKEAMQKAMDVLLAAAKGAGFDCVMYSTKTPSLLTRFKDSGFDVTGEDVTVLVARI